MYWMKKTILKLEEYEEMIFSMKKVLKRKWNIISWSNEEMMKENLKNEGGNY